MKTRYILWIYSLSRLITVSIMYFATIHIRYLGFMAHPDDLLKFNLPLVLLRMGNFDGIHYLRIAQRGYEQYTQAFFPLYPLLIQTISYVTLGNTLIAGIIISNSAFLVALLLLKSYLDEVYKNTQITRWTIIYLTIFPSSFFFMFVYTESLFLLLLICVLYTLIRKQYHLTFIFGYLLGITRINGIFISLPLFLSLFWFDQNFKRHKISLLTRTLTFLGPSLGLATYMIYLTFTRHDPLYFFHVQEAFGTGRSHRLIIFPQVIYRYIKIITTSSHTFQYYIALLELVTSIVVLLTLFYSLYKILQVEKRDNYYPLRLGIILFSICSIHLSTFTGTLIGIPRYTLIALAFFIALPTYLKSLRSKIVIGVIFIILYAILLAYFTQGYFIS